MDKYKELLEEIKKRGIKINDTILKEVLFNGALENLYDLVDKNKYKTKEEFLNYYKDLNQYKLDNIAQKIISQRHGALQNRDGSFSTHLMSSGTVDNGVGVAFPTLQENPVGEWYSPHDPYKEARQKGEVLEFPTEEMARDIAEGRWKKTKEFSKLNKKYNKRLKTFVKGFGEENIRAIYNYFRQKGLTPEQAAGITGNLAQESRFNPNITNSIGAFGIAQWLGDRKQGLYSYAKKNKRNYNDLTTQLDYMWYELNSKEKRALRKLQQASTPEEAAHLFEKYYERSEDKEGTKGYANRLNYATHVYQLFGYDTTQQQSDRDTIEQGMIRSSDEYITPQQNNYVNDKDLWSLESRLKNYIDARNSVEQDKTVRLLQGKAQKFNVIKDFIEGMELKPVDISYK